MSATPLTHLLTRSATEQDAINCNRFANRFKVKSSIFNFFNNPFEDPKVLLHYQYHRIKNNSLMHPLYWIMTLLGHSHQLYVASMQYEDIWLMRMIVFSHVVLTLMWAYICNKVSSTTTPGPLDMSQEKFKDFVSTITNLSNIIVVMATLTNGLFYAWQSSLGPCLSHEHEVFHFGCNPSHCNGGTPTFPLVQLLFGNIFVVTTLRSHSPFALCLSYLLTCASVVIAAILSPDPIQSLNPILAGFCTIFIYNTMEDSSVAMFKALLELETNNRENVAEQKHFIGNVAHDLKTPLHGFSMCVDELLVDVDESLAEGNHKNRVINLIKTCQANCSFMTMAINRTVDYTKSSSNVTLTPSIETVSVEDCTRWAVSCLNSTQNDLRIEALPLPKQMCKFILTDKHWLMENTLCYLSNAVKYSSKGRIVVNISLVGSSGGPFNYVPESKNGSSAGRKDNSLVCDEDDSMRNDEITRSKKGRTVSKASRRRGRRERRRVAENSTNLVVTSDKEKLLCPPQPHVRISVLDEGIGVSEEKKQVLFKPFQQTMRLAGGTGLGLYSLAMRIDTLKGRYGVSSRSDGVPGSEFWFSIPYVPDETYKAELNSESIESKQYNISHLNGTHSDSCDQGKKDGVLPNASSCPNLTTSTTPQRSIADQARPRALVVDDSVVIAKATMRMLMNHGYAVDVASNGADGLEFMKSVEYKVVVMDLQMPVMDGLESTRRIRHLESSTVSHRHKQFIIGASANGTDDVKKEAVASGMDMFVSKPFTIKDLVRHGAPLLLEPVG